MSEALDARCMVGYFTSSTLSELALALTAYFRNQNSSSLRLLVSPHLESKDIDVLERAVENDQNLLPLLFPDIQIDENGLRSKTLEIFLYLIVSKKIELKIAVMSGGLFHTKAWVYRTANGLVAIHGSGNATKGGLFLNFEQLTLSRSWKNEDASQICDALESRFESIWNDAYPQVKAYTINQKTIDAIRKLPIRQDGQIERCALKELNEELISEKNNNRDGYVSKEIKIPDWLNYTEGDYQHQGEAVVAWVRNKYRGILSIATGGGKTLTSLIAATILANEKKRLLIVIAVPTKTLLEQWNKDVVAFGLEPLNQLNENVESFNLKLKGIARSLRVGVNSVEAIIITHEKLKSFPWKELEKNLSNVDRLLIGDEVHNLGSAGFKESAPEFFNCRLGLSATFERQYDEEGTGFLKEYFGDVVYEFNLSSAIGNCLVPYKYYCHEIQLTQTESDEFIEITQEINSISYAFDGPEGDPTTERLKRLCLKRRKIVEAAFNKVSELGRILRNQKIIDKSLIFCTDKYPDQLKKLNQLLNEIGINWHQVTQDESKNRKKLQEIVKNFNEGVYQVLTSKRVLDEGFNVPQTETAYLLASNTVRRQWIQRLGRVLRKSDETDKKFAVIHDFLVRPPKGPSRFDPDLKTLMRGEIDRVLFFSRLASNNQDSESGFRLANKLLDELA